MNKTLEQVAKALIEYAENKQIVLVGAGNIEADEVGVLEDFLPNCYECVMLDNSCYHIPIPVDDDISGFVNNVCKISYKLGLNANGTDGMDDEEIWGTDGILVDWKCVSTDDMIVVAVRKEFLNLKNTKGDMLI